MELYAAVRRSVYVEGLSERAAARRFGLARETVRKMLRYRRPPGYRRGQPARRPKLDAFTGVIDQILREDQARPKKQRHTATRIGERLRAEYGFTGGDTIVKAYVRAQRLGGQEMFVPLTHPPGDAQADFGEALVVIAGVEQKAHYLVVDLPHSDDGFVQAFPAETTEAFCAGHNAAFRYFGGVPRRIVYDNTKLAVARVAEVVAAVVAPRWDIAGHLHGAFDRLAAHGCVFPFSGRASRSGACVNASGNTFSATSRSSFVSRARYTSDDRTTVDPCGRRSPADSASVEARAGHGLPRRWRHELATACP